MKTISLSLEIAQPEISVDEPGIHETTLVTVSVQAKHLYPWAYEQLVSAKALYARVAAREGVDAANAIVRLAVQESKVDR